MKINNNKRSYFLPGDNWLYFKIYTGENFADTILTETIEPLVQNLISDLKISQWFFIRYADPQFHLRIRFKLIDNQSLNSVFELFNNGISHYVQDDLIWNIQLEIYQREILRYGSNTMVLAESIFYYNTVLVVKFIKLIEGEEGEKLRWLFAIKIINSFLDSFDLSDLDKLNFMVGIRENFISEFNMESSYRKQLNVKYRRHRNEIENFLDDDYNSELKIIIETWNEELKPLAQEILNLKRRNKLESNFNYLLGSFIHMFMNRIFKSQNRKHEMVCYDFLSRYYRTILGKRKIKILV